MVNIDVPDPPENWVKPSVTVRPAGEEAESVTVPVNPLIGATVTVAVLGYPALASKLVGEAEIV
jgi:hypothetical protein